MGRKQVQLILPTQSHLSEIAYRLLCAFAIPIAAGHCCQSLYTASMLTEMQGLELWDK